MTRQRTDLITFQGTRNGTTLERTRDWIRKLPLTCKDHEASKNQFNDIDILKDDSPNSPPNEKQKKKRNKDDSPDDPPDEGEKRERNTKSGRCDTEGELTATLHSIRTPK